MDNESVGADGLCEPERRVTEPRSHLEHGAGPNAPGQHHAEIAHEGTDDRELPLASETFHLGAHGVGLGHETVQIGFDFRGEETQGTHLRTAS